MNWSDLLGHQAQIQMLFQAVRRNRIPHALLFGGPAGIGKHTIALLFARSLLCERSTDDDLEACGSCSSCRSFDAGNHPDCITVGLPEGKGIIPIALIAGEGEERGRSGLCYDLSLRPMLSRRKVAIVDDADCMNAEAANAFLKTLEEPTPDTFIILVSSQPDSLLPTIRSRCQLLRFHPLQTQDVSELLLRLEWVDDRKMAEEIAALSEGSLYQGAQLLDPRWRDLKTLLWNGLASAAIDVGKLSAALIEHIESKSADTGEKKHAWNWLLRFAVEYYRGQLADLSRQMSDELSMGQISDLSSELWWKLENANLLLERCLDEELRRDDNLNLTLTLEAWLAELSQMQKQTPAAT